MSVLWLDYETRSDVNLKDCGADIYSRHPSTEILMAAWAIDNGPVQLWDAAGGEALPSDVAMFLCMGHGVVRAYNAPFEMAITQNVLGLTIDPTQWRCAQVLAYSLSFAGQLKDVLGAISLENKDTEGPRLIKLFSVPQRTTKKQPHLWRDRTTNPADWTLFEKYCLQDVNVLRKLWRWCDGFDPMPDAEWDLWHLDYKINQRGLPVDMALVEDALAAMLRLRKVLVEELTHLMHGEKITPGPLAKRLGCTELTPKGKLKFNKEVKEKLLETCEGEDLRIVEISMALAQLSSASKWSAFASRTDQETNVIRNTLQFKGASRTGRWAGRGVQVHNMKWTSKDQNTDTLMIRLGMDVDMDQISRAVRGAICAPEGMKLVVSDLSSIEARLAGWLCGCDRINKIFAEGLDLYKDLAAHIFSVPYDQVAKEQRQFAKPAALGAQYRLGAVGLRKYAESFGVTLSEKEAQHQVQTYRSLYPEIPSFWQWIAGAIEEAMAHPRTLLKGYGLGVYYEPDDFLSIQLPSGRWLRYHHPYYDLRYIPGFEHMGLVRQFTYSGMVNFQWMSTQGYITPTVEQAQRHHDKGLTYGVSAHSGGLLENIIQAIARDILGVWLQCANAAGLNIVGHVHDEIICLEHASEAYNALDILNQTAALSIPWAKGLKLEASGYVAQRYRKE